YQFRFIMNKCPHCNAPAKSLRIFRSEYACPQCGHRSVLRARPGVFGGTLGGVAGMVFLLTARKVGLAWALPVASWHLPLLAFILMYFYGRLQPILETDGKPQ